MEKTEAFEYKHLECLQSQVNSVIREHNIFYWDLVATQTVVSKESHLESGGVLDSEIYSVTTTERFVTIDLKRNRDIPNIGRIKDVERKYFEISRKLIRLGCSPLDNYSSPPPEKSFGCAIALSYLFFIFPGILMSRRAKAYKERVSREYQQLKTELDKILKDNKGLLNI